MSFFRNLTCFRLSPGAVPTIEQLVDGAGQHRAREPGPLELATRGFMSPFGADDDRLTFASDPYVLVQSQEQSRIIPSAVIARELDKRIKVIVDAQGRRPGAKERKRLKEEVVTDLLPRAFINARSTSAYLDRKEGWIVVDTASRKSAESAVSLVREALGRFPAVPLAPKESPRNIMTQWLIDGRLPESLALSDEVELRDPAEAGAIWRGRRQDLESDEVREHLKAGKQVFQLGLVYADRISFVLSEDLSIRKLKMLDIVLDSLAEANAEDATAERVACFNLMVRELSVLLAALARIFGIERPSERDA